MLAVIILGVLAIPAVAQNTPDSISVMLPSASIAIGQTEQLTATGIIGGATKDLTGIVTWNPLDTKVATISNTGLLAAVGQGTTTIQASLGGKTSPAIQITVTAPISAPVVTPPSSPVVIPNLVSISVTPDHVLIEPGKTQELKAIGTYSSGPQKELKDATWSSSAQAVATIGNDGLVTAIGQGRTDIKASSGGISSAPISLIVGPSEVPITLTPSVIQPVNGKLPSPVSVGVAVQNCAGTDLTAGNYSLSITGAGLSFSTPNVGKCLITSNLTIDASVSAGTASVILLNNNKPVGSGNLSIMDTAAGPIPPGLSPQVDVAWEIMGEKNCSDTFGKRVAQSMYCIQLVIGNNTGHPLQLAGIGFMNQVKSLGALGIKETSVVNSSYASTRAVLLHSQTYDLRNTIFNALQAGGIIMAGFTPYFSGVHQPNAKAHYLAAIALVSGPMLQAFNIVAPDPVITQLKNLDDQSLRDNLIIPNNFPVRTVVFVEKGAVTMALRELNARLKGTAWEARTKVKEMKAARNEAQHIQNSDEYQKTKEVADTLNAIAQASDKTIGASKGSKYLLKKSDPLLVKLALGSIVIVGNPIEYLPRIQVQTNAAGQPVSISITPGQQNVMLTGSQQFTATVTGSANTNVTWSLVDGSGAASNIGSISATGNYTAPQTMPLPTPNTVNVKATSVADPSKSAIATVTIVPISVTISPTNPTVALGTTQAFTANTDVTWSVLNPGPATGTIAANGVYTAPTAAAGGAAGTAVIVQATSTVDPSKSITTTTTLK